MADTKYVIDCSAAPFVPEGMRVAPANEQIASRFTGTLTLTPGWLALYLDPGQQRNGRVVGTDLRTRLAGKPVLTPNVLRHLLKYPDLIPASCDGLSVFFWGTVFINAFGVLCVLYLTRRRGVWYWHCAWLEGVWYFALPAALPAS